MFELRVYPDTSLLMRAAAERFVSLYETVSARQGHFSVALAGGSTPQALYRLLAEEMFSRYIDWSQVHFFWGDERGVPPDHGDSNYRMARLALLDQVNVPGGNIHRIHAEKDPFQAADEYEAELYQFFKGRGDQVRLDLVLLGMGDDGHTASLFPGTAALEETERLVVANEVPQLETWRITLTPPVLNAARNVLFLVSGAAKAETLHAVMEGGYRPHELPVQLIEPPEGQMAWLVDEAAGKLLSRKG